MLRFSLDDPEDESTDGVILENRFIGPDGTQLASMKVADFAPPKSALQPLRGIDITIDLRGTLLPTPRVFHFEIWADDLLRASVPLSAWLWTDATERGPRRRPP